MESAKIIVNQSLEPKMMVTSQNWKAKDEVINVQLFKNVVRVVATMEMGPMFLKEMGTHA